MKIEEIISTLIITFTIVIPLITTLIYMMISTNKIENEYKKKVIKYLDKLNNDN